MAVLAPLVPTDPVFPAGSFREAAVYPGTTPAGAPLGLATRGSWLGADAFRGEYRTSWLRPEPRFALLVAGYPALAPCRLEVEVRQKDGRQTAIAFAGENPGEHWTEWRISLPAGAVAIRLHAVDGASSAREWLAFSVPFGHRAFSPRDLWPFAQLAATGCLAAALIYGPGLAWLMGRRANPGDWALALFFGPMLLAAIGAACWALGGWILPAITARIGIAAVLAVLGARLGRRPEPECGPAGAGLAVTALAVLLTAFAIAKANVSQGPPGELYAGTVSRSLAVGGRSDSRVSYHLAQAAAHHYGPYSPEAERYFSPWSFSSRGPFAGLLAAPIVLAEASAVPTDMPDQRWQPFDPQGFAAYRIALIVLASLAGWAVFGVAAEMTDEAWGGLAAATAMLSPFYVHELYFTWPKMMAASCVLAGFLLGFRRGRPFASGTAVGIGYLFHPSAVLAALFLPLWVADAGAAGGSRRLTQVAWFGLGALCFVGPWVLLDRTHPIGWGQSGFFHYVFLADTQSSGLLDWIRSRLASFGCTFVPFYLVVTHAAHQAINAFGGKSGAAVHFDFLYWNTLPFGLGLPVFFSLAPVLAHALRRMPWAAWGAVFGPALSLLIYWGADETGLMRECGHTLFLSVAVFGAWILRNSRASWMGWAMAGLTAAGWIALRAADIGWMAFGTTLDHSRDFAGAYYCWNDILSVSAAVTVLSAAAGVAFRLCQPAAIEASARTGHVGLDNPVPQSLGRDPELGRAASV
jgi:hypothetical protein